MPGRNDLAQVEHANKQLATLHFGVSKPSIDTFTQQIYEALVVCQATTLLLCIYEVVNNVYCMVSLSENMWLPGSSYYMYVLHQCKSPCSRLLSCTHAGFVCKLHQDKRSQVAGAVRQSHLADPESMSGCKDYNWLQSLQQSLVHSWIQSPQQRTSYFA